MGPGVQDINFAIEEISRHEAQNAGIAKWCRGNKQHLHLIWQEESGSRLEEIKGSRTTPFEKNEWVIRQVNKKGWSRPKALDKWNEHLADSWERDNKGEDGELRLWLPKKEYKDQERTKYLDQGAKTSSEIIKDPNAEDVFALTMHVHKKAESLNFQHAFFHGGAGVPFLGVARDEQNADGASEDGGRCGGEESTDAESGAPPLKKLKGNIVKLRAAFNQTMATTVSKVARSSV